MTAAECDLMVEKETLSLFEGGFVFLKRECRTHIFTEFALFLIGPKHLFRVKPS